MTDAQREQPTQEELEAYFNQLRDAPATEIVAQAFSMLGTAAEVKLGRPDARMLIDALDGLVAAVKTAMGETGTRMEQGVAQLKMAQVQQERAAGGTGEADAGTAAGAGASAPGGSAPGGSGAPASGQGRPAGRGAPGAGPGQGKATDRLWIPGRDPRPQ